MTLPDCMIGPSEPCKGFCELQTQRDALLADAERYRWLKEYGPALFVNHQWAGTECLDAAIDAARRKDEQPNC